MKKKFAAMIRPFHTLDAIRAALQFIPSTTSRDEWVRIGMAIRSEFADEAGYELFREWSEPAENFDERSCRAAWRSFKPGGGVTIASLLKLAQAHGYKPPSDGQQAPPPSPEVVAARKRELAEERERSEAETRQRHEGAAVEAKMLWEVDSKELADPTAHEYLRRKGVKAHGLRLSYDGALLVPLRDASGALWNVQRIFPNGEKRFLSGGRKSGLLHLLDNAPAVGDEVSTVENAGAAGRPADPAVKLIAEGYATAATVHEATGWPTACALDAGNLAKVAQALRQQHPGALLMLCGDDDRSTESKTGRNPGRDKATAAAQAVQGIAIFPQDLPGGGSDFNDMHQAHGLEAVRACIAAAVQAHQAHQAHMQALQATADASEGDTPPDQEKHTSGPPADHDGHGGGGGHGHGNGNGHGSGNGAAPTPERDRFTLTDDGVFHHGVNKDGEPLNPEWVCSRLEVLSRTRNADGGEWGYLLQFADPLGHLKTWSMPARLLSGDGGEYRAHLLSLGLRCNTAQRARNLLTQYLQTRNPEAFTTCTDRIGWHGRAFVLPRETIGGDDAEPVVFQSDAAMENTFTQRGTLEQWRERVGALCVGNSRLAFAVSCAFAGPLLRVAGVESGGFHFRGGSSTGKTTALRVAASVNGGANYLQRWRTTDNALEAIAAQHCDALLVLDELAQVDAKTAGECAYMLANEASKSRATRNGAPRPRLSWRLVFLSAGELSLADHMAEGARRARTGQEVRMVDIPADAGAGHGLLENLHGIEGGGSAFSRQIVEAASRCYGTPGRAWLQWLTEHTDTLRADVRTRMQALAGQIIPEAAGGQVQRVGLRFALVGAAGEMATAAGLTGWPAGEAAQAARACFNAWLATRGGTGDGEAVAMLRQVRLFLEAHAEGRFTWWHRAHDDHASKTLHRAGYRRMVGEDGQAVKTDADHERRYGERMHSGAAESISVEYFVLPEVFRTEVCKGFDHAAVCRTLFEFGCLKPDASGRFDCKPRLPLMGLVRCYRISPEIFTLDL